ncbi:MAG: hypothetical protein V3V19_08320 [Cocleimonas sp.]
MNHNKAEVYSATGFSDLLASPTFYAIPVIAFVLGFSSIFGFLQTPEKLKSAVDIITKKVVLQNKSDNKSTKLVSDLTIKNITKKHNDRNTASSLGNRYSIFMDKFTHENERQLPKRSIQTIQLASFDYDITSKHFWGDLELNNPHASVLEDSILRNRDSLLMGVPMNLDLLPKIGDEKYSLRINRNY